MRDAAFSCNCGQIEGSVAQVPEGGLHLVCQCASCRAGARYCGEEMPNKAPVDLYLTPPQHVTVRKGLDKLSPFAFSQRGVLRWQASCCGVQMFSSQPNPKTAFMSVRTDRMTKPEALGPVRTWSFIAGAKGLAQHKGKRALAGLVFKAMRARLTGLWRASPLYDPKTARPIAEVTLVSREAKKGLLDN